MTSSTTEFAPFLTDIIDHDISTEFSIHQSIYASQTSTGTSDDDCLSVKANFCLGLRVWRELCCQCEFAFGINVGYRRRAKQVRELT